MEWSGRHLYCHQRPERSFFLGGYQFLVCARCTGLFLGYAAGLISFLAGLRLPWQLLLLLGLPCAADGLLQYYTSYESNNGKRVVSGFLFGFAYLQLFSLLVVLLLRWLF